MSQYDELKRLAEHHRSLGHAYTVATPAAVLSLIAENERLHKLISWQGDANIEVTISAGQLMKHMDERDQLKAENAGLRTGYQAYERVNAELKAEVGRLHKVASELRQWTSCNHLHHEPHEQHADDVYCKVLERIDAALSKGEQS